METFDELKAVLKKNEEQMVQMIRKKDHLNKAVSSLKKQLEALGLETGVPCDLDRGIEEYEALTMKKAILSGKLESVNAS